MNITVISQNIQRVMEEKGLNANQLSKKSGISKATLSRIINGINKTVSYETLIKVADALDVEISVLDETALNHSYIVNDLKDTIKLILEDEELQVDGIVCSEFEKNIIEMELDSLIEKIRKIREMKK